MYHEKGTTEIKGTNKGVESHISSTQLILFNRCPNFYFFSEATFLLMDFGSFIIPLCFPLHLNLDRSPFTEKA